MICLMVAPTVSLDGGSTPFPLQPAPHNPSGPTDVNTWQDRWNAANRLASNTGNWSRTGEARRPLQLFEDVGRPDITNPPDQQLPVRTSSRSQRASESLLSTEHHQWTELNQRIGSGFEILPSRTSSIRSRPIFMFDVTLHSHESLVIILSELLSSELLSCTGEELVSGKVEGPGGSQVYKLILRIPLRSGGMVTDVFYLIRSRTRCY